MGSQQTGPSNWKAYTFDSKVEFYFLMELAMGVNRDY
jgi:hypothetical protein